MKAGIFDGHVRLSFFSANILILINGVSCQKKTGVYNLEFGKKRKCGRDHPSTAGHTVYQPLLLKIEVQAHVYFL